MLLYYCEQGTHWIIEITAYIIEIQKANNDVLRGYSLAVLQEGSNKNTFLFFRK